MATPILVTGGAGFIGSHTCKALKGAGYDPLTLDNLARGHRSAVRWGKLYELDLLNSADILKVFLEAKPKAVIHFAGLASVSESCEDPQEYYLNNVSGTIALLRAMKASGCQYLVFSSSCSTYGDASEEYLSERASQNPMNPYAWTKLVVEKILLDYDLAYGLRSVSLRYFNAAGSDPDQEIGECHDPETHLIPRVLLAALKGSSLKVFGQDYPTPDGTCVRDYIHVTDLADGHVKALEYLQKGGATSAFNLGTGKGYSVKQVIEVAEKVTGKKIHYMIGPRRAGDPPRLVADAGLALKMLGWIPRYSDLESQIKHSWNWIQNQNNRA